MKVNDRAADRLYAVSPLPQFAPVNDFAASTVQRELHGIILPQNHSAILFPSSFTREQ
jgi:hypothetical protein